MSSSLAYPGIQDLIISTQQLWSSKKISDEIAAAIDPVLKSPEAFAPAGSYPVTYGGNPVEKGDTFRITAPGTMGAITVNTEDLLIALVDTPAQVDANWMVAESNRDQATETVKGVAKLATQVIADAGTNDTDIMTPLKTATAPVRAHASNHENGGSDEISVAGLSGELADDQPPKAHDLGGTAHNADTLANLNAKISDATLDDSGDPRDPNAHASTHENGGADEISVAGLSGELADDQPPKAHDLGGTAHNADTLANLNAKISDATLDDSGDPRDPNAHASTHENGGADEISVAGLSGELADPQPPKTHAASHTDGTDDIQNATNAQKGLATAAHIALLEKLENMPINNQTGTSYTPVLADANKWLFCSNASPFSFTIPTNAAVPFPVGTAFPVVRGGTGSLTFLHPGVTVYGELTITEQYFVAVCKKLATDTWIIVGGTGDAAVPETLFDAGTFLYATVDNTPEPKTAAETRAILNVDDGADVTGANAPQAHAASHQNGGSDEISVAGLSGVLADNQNPAAHASEHTDGTDDIQNATAAQKGLATAAQITKLDGIAAGADVTFSKIQEDQYNTSETDTGLEWNGKTLYMKSFSGTVPSGVADLISGGIDELVEAKGWANNGGVRNVLLAYHDGTNQAYLFKDTGTNDLSIFGAGAFVGQNYKVTAFYTKL